jgi:uncharacterized protein YjlB
MNSVNQAAKILSYTLKDDGIFPNNHLPAILYKEVIILSPESEDKPVINLFSDHNWRNAWTNGIYDYHHYHSVTHEVLGICSGHATVLLGGDKGVTLELSKGDVLLIPAGVAHKRLQASDDFSCVGAYPNGMDYEIKTGEKDERPAADVSIRKVPLPGMDPVFGKDGPLLNYWKNKRLNTFKNKVM